MKSGQLIVASNRLPLVVERDADGKFATRPSTGGLVAALSPVIEERGGAWIGWPGVSDVPTASLRRALGEGTSGCQFVPIELTSLERDAFYLGFSNEIVWPLFHDLQTNCNFDPAYWEVYERVNRKFAVALAERVKPGDAIWVHDYHLMRVGSHLRALGVDNAVGFFLHIPFPGPDIFRKLPWRGPIARGLMEFDLVGFQTIGDEDNFLRSMHSVGLIDGAHLGPGRTRVVRAIGATRRTHVGAFPIGIDLRGEREDARSEEAREAARALRRDIAGRHLLIGVDRLDYTKGIPQRLRAFRTALERHPELRGHASLLQLVVPSREDIPEYSALREEIERLVGAINGELSEPGWVPVIYMHGTVERRKLRGWYQAADVALVTPLKDGMNLVAKEYCAAHDDEQGALLLSEFAGAAAQLQEGALLVNPNDHHEVAEMIVRACRMSKEEQRRRMVAMRAVVEREDVFWWASTFLDQLRRARPEAPAESLRV